MNIRKQVFFALDKKNGGDIARQYHQIKKANEDDLYAEKLKKIQINRLLKYINKSIPFYKDKKIMKLEDCPVVNKVMMKENIEQFRTTESLEIGKIRHTSGSTGIPFEIQQDKRKSNRIKAELIYYRKSVNDEIGNRFINLISPSRLEKISKIEKIKQNVIPFDVTKMDDSTMENLHKILSNDNSITYMMGYASALKKIADYFEDEDLKGSYSLNAIVSSSEILTDNVVSKLSRIFGCPVYDRYSNEDNGFIAQTNGKTHEFLINRASYYIEILKMDSNCPAEENEIGRIVITDLFNYAQPFVRYDTGDLGAYSYKKISEKENRYILTKLAGRISDILYDENDCPINTFAIGCALEPFNKIKQYRIVQIDKNEFKLIINDVYRHYNDEEFRKILKKVLGQKARICIEYVDDIPTLSSGKFRRIECLYTPDK